jgi:hypothetical protein
MTLRQPLFVKYAALILALARAALLASVGMCLEGARRTSRLPR